MKKIIAIIALTATLGFVGCEDFLVEAPLLTQSTEISLSTYNGLNSAIAGAYSPLVSLSWYGSFFVLDAEMRACNATIPVNTNFRSGRMRPAHDMSYNPSVTSGLWGYAYYVISAVNNVMDNLEGKDVDGITVQDLNNLKAEALFLRAISHFDLVRTYATAYAKDKEAPGVPIILYTDASATEQPARNTVAEVYEQVIEDLLDAESIIADDYARSGVTDAKAVVTKPAIQALLSRVYLYSQNWQGAADYATKVINNSKYSLWTAADYPTVWNRETPTDGGEIIFEVYSKKSNAYDAWWEGPSHMTNPIGYADCAANTQLTDLFEAGDVRGDMFRTDPDNVSNSLWTLKYQGKGDGDAISTPDANNVVVLRLSEMYLNRAEAIVNGATVPGATALSDVNEIRAHRGVASISSIGAEGVFLERRLELNFEGHLWYDYARTKRGYTNNNMDIFIPADYYMFALPIPKREMDVNENLVQNPGY